jgi:hypothetical protein
MTSGKLRIDLRRASRPGFFARWFRRRRRPTLDLLPPADSDSIDFTLRRLAAVRAVRGFVEAIENYTLQTHRTVHVVSKYVIPDSPGLQEEVPQWLAARVRFGVVQGAGGIGYLGIRAVDLTWDDQGTELFLHLDAKVAPGTRAFIAAYLGEGDGTLKLQELPPKLIGSSSPGWLKKSEPSLGEP